MADRDLAMMQTACAEGRRWMGASSPNPAVGSVACDAQGNILAVAAHRQAGQEHAEANILKICREQNLMDRIDTIYATLEPCNHHGRTPPCSEAIIEAGIRRVVIGTRDPNPAVTGGGAEKLKQAGIEVVTGIGEDECKMSMHAFIHSMQTGKPWITIKRAFTPDGSMIPPPGQKSFTSQNSLRLAHRLRKKCDAIITGSGTILADNPRFDVRHVADYPGKRRWLAIIDRRGRVPQGYLQKAAEYGLDALIYNDIDAAIADLTQKRARDILVESGPAVSQSMLDKGLWTMRVDIEQGDPDKITAAFNPHDSIAFATQAFRWRSFLPEEQE